MRFGRWLVAAGLLVSMSACEVGGEELTGWEQIEQTMDEGLPDLEQYELVEFDDREALERLESEMAEPDEEPVRIELPILRDDGTVGTHTWTAYHVDVRELQEGYLTNEGVQAGQEEPTVQLPPDFEAVLERPSRTFQGVPPSMGPEEIAAFAEEAPEMPDERIHQASVLNIIGEGLEGAYYGNPEDPTAHVIAHLETLLAPHVGEQEAAELAAGVPENYLIYRQEDFQPEMEHGEEALGEPPEELHHEHGGVDSSAVAPQVHTTTRVLRPAMVADSSVFDPETGNWLVTHWFDRVDAAANRQNSYFWFASVAPDTPQSSLPSDNNRIFVQTEIAAYLVLTPHGKSLIDYPSSKCAPSDSFINEVTQLSTDAPNHDNEYWMWWTNNYSGGCAWISTLDRAPGRGAAGWSGYGNGTTDWTGAVFMHESGHIIGATHNNPPNSTETSASHRCRLFGAWDIGPTGPSLMSYASGNQTYCLARSDGTTRRNLTKVAEFLHPRLQP